MTRKPKTHRQRAAEELALADRVVTRLAKQCDLLRTKLRKVEADHDAAVLRRNHPAPIPTSSPPRAAAPPHRHSGGKTHG